MSHRYARSQTVVLLVIIAVGSSAMARQARQNAPAPQAPAPAGQANAGLNISQMPTPEIGKPYRFSLCSGQLLAPGTVSRPCGRVTFRLQNGSFLPPGLTLDGFGVISGTTNVDVSKLNIKICAIQLGSYGSNFNCQGQSVGFAGGKAAVRTPPAPAAAPATPASSGGGGGGAGGVKTSLIVGGLGLLGGAAYLASKEASVCTAPGTANFNACVQTQGCGVCAAYLAEAVPYCDCIEQKEAAAAGVGAACRAAADAARQAARFCNAPPPMSLAPNTRKQ